MIYMDFRKAFDSVSHVTVEALEDFVGNMVQGLGIFIRCVKVEGTTSDVLPVISGVPQGSMFLLYV